VAGRKPKDEFVDKLEEAVPKAKKNREWRHDYIALMMRDLINVEKGEKHGEIRGTIKTYKRISIRCVMTGRFFMEDMVSCRLNIELLV